MPLDHTLALPEYSDEWSSQVSAPNSPALGMGLNDQTRLPVRTSNAWTIPGGARLSYTWSVIELPTTMTLPATSGRLAVKFNARIASGTPTVRSARPPVPNAESGFPVLASIDRR